MTEHKNHVDDIAMKRAKAGEAWRPYLYRLVPEVPKDGCDQVMMVTGCDTTKFVRGPRKGQIKFLTDQNRKRSF